MKKRLAIWFASVALATTLFVGALVVPGLASIPEPIKIVPVTEAQIKEGVKNDKQAKIHAKAIKRATAAAREVYRRNGCSDSFSDLTGRTAYESGLSPRLLAAVVFVESSCRPDAVSGRDSIGLMQVNPKIWGHRKDLKDPEKNMKLGASILASYIRQFGIIEGLHHYNGYSEIHEHSYVNKVLAAGQIVVIGE